MGAHYYMKYFKVRKCKKVKWLEIWQNENDKIWNKLVKFIYIKINTPANKEHAKRSEKFKEKTRENHLIPSILNLNECFKGEIPKNKQFFERVAWVIAKNYNKMTSIIESCF